jgi:micrococcal nuclease
MPRSRSLPFSVWSAPAFLAGAALVAASAQGQSLHPVGAGSARDSERGSFAACGGGKRVTCIVDGDTFWYRGEKIRIADINTPEVGTPGCAAEARLGAAATRRLGQLLNAGPFTLEPVERATDRYGRRLRVVTRKGASLGGTLEAEGLAEPWRGRRGSWC